MSDFFGEEELHPCFRQPQEPAPTPASREVGRLAGKMLRDGALSKMQGERAVLLQKIRAAMRDLSQQTRQPVTADDVRDFLNLRYPGWESGRRESWLATVFVGDHWRNVGYVQSAIPSNRGRRVGAYVYVP